MELAEIAKKYGVTGIMAMVITWLVLNVNELKTDSDKMQTLLIECYKERYPPNIRTAGLTPDYSERVELFAILPHEITIKDERKS